MDNLYIISFSIPVIVCLFWFFELFFSSGKNAYAKKHLAVFMFCGFITFLGELLFHNNILSLYRNLYFFIVFFTILQIPALYIYLLTLTESHLKKRRYLKHIIFPFFIASILLFFHHVYLVDIESIEVFHHFYNPTDFNSKQNITYIVELASRYSFLMISIFYLIMINLKIKKHLKIILNHYSEINKKKLKWIGFSSFFYILMVLISSTVCNPSTKDVIYNPEYTIVFPFIFLGITFWLIGFLGNRQKMIIMPVDDIIKKVNLPEDFKKSLVDKLNRFMKEKKIYLIPDITLIELAKEVGTNRFYLSKIINEEFKMNFNSFINYYRIKYALEIMQNKEEEFKNFGEIAIMVGYSNYISFIRNFKKIHKVSPGEFLKDKNKKEA